MWSCKVSYHVCRIDGRLPSNPPSPTHISCFPCVPLNKNWKEVLLRKNCKSSRVVIIWQRIYYLWWSCIIWICEISKSTLNMRTNSTYGIHACGRGNQSNDHALLFGKTQGQHIFARWTFSCQKTVLFYENTYVVVKTIQFVEFFMYTW